MPRPKLVSDADILDATRRVLLRQGTGFTLSEVATEVGLSRAALIQRFDNKAGLERHLAAHQLAALERLIDAHPVTNKGPQRTLDFLDKALAEFEISALLADPAAAALLRDAIVARLDEPSRQRASEVADLVVTVLTGAAREGDRAHVASRLRLALKLIYTGRPS
jgi:TetR/AcrR family macrolide resistance operon transcriptional repressor